MREVQVEVSNELQKIENSDKLLLTIAREMYIETARRVFVDGKMTDGKRWKYSTKSILANYYSFSTKAGYNKFAGSKEKRKNLNWVTLKNGARVFEVAGGFKSIKEADGHPNPFDFTGQLRRAYNYEGLNGSSVLGFIDAKRVAPQGGASSTTNSEIVDGLESKQGEIFALMDSELKLIDTITKEYLDVVFNG